MAKSIEEIHAALQGPVNSIPTTFTRDSAIDYAGIGNMIECNIRAGGSVTLLTYGDSQLELLSDSELVDLTRFIVSQSAGRSLTVAASRAWNMHMALEFAQTCRQIGVDLLMLYVAEYTRTSVDTQLAEFYKSVARVIPVMLVGWPEHRLLDQIRDEPRICCFKEDGTVEYAIETMRRYGDRWKMLTGGGLWRNYTQWPLGCRAFMSPWCILKPQVNDRYYQAMLHNDLQTACDVITQLDFPLFECTSKYKGGWQTAWRAMLEVLGIAQRYRRPPMPSAGDADLESICSDLQRLHVL